MLLEPLDRRHQSREGPGALVPAREVPGSREPRAGGMAISCSGAFAVLSRQRNGLESAESIGWFGAVARGLFADLPDWTIQQRRPRACACLPKHAASVDPGHPGRLGLAARMPPGDEVERAGEARPALGRVGQHETQTDNAGTAGGAPSPHLRVRRAQALRARRSRSCSDQRRGNPCAE